jgi:spore coat polysaccharide biosynthesis protein SpsF
MKYLTIIQARSSSSRLPRKSLMSVAGIPLVHLCAIRAKNDFSKLIVATSNEASDDDLAKMLLEAGVDVFRGSLTNVLSRFINIADSHMLTDEDCIIRLTGDNPIVDSKFLEILRFSWEKFGLDYLSGHPADMSNSNWPYGLSAEFVNVGLLRDGYLRDKSDNNLEHVTTYAKENAENKAFGDQVTSLTFRNKYFLTIDTKEDFERVSEVFERNSPAACFLSVLDSIEG